MWYILQLRNLKKEVQRQLDEIKDVEKAASSEDGSQHSEGSEDVKEPYMHIPGIEIRTKEDGSKQHIVHWTSPKDPTNPANGSTFHRIRTTLLLIAVSCVVTATSSIDSAVLEPAAKDLGVSNVTEALGGTGIYLVGFGIGTLLTSPLSELVGRYPVYLGTSTIFGAWLLGAALSPNIGAQIAFRFLAGTFGCAPLTVGGGSIADIWSPKERTWAFPMFAIGGFGGPILGPVLGAYIGYDPQHTLTWRWSEWIMLIIDGLVILCVIAFMEETFSPRLLNYKAYYFRELTGDQRFLSELEATGKSVGQIVKISFVRPFHLGLEPIIILFTLYLTVVYIVLFTFFDGYGFIFEMTYGINSGLSNTIFVALFIGVLLALITVPIVYNQTTKQLDRDGDDGKGHQLHRELRLLYAMYGAPAIPIGLFWMAWTDYRSISIWSPIAASVVVGFGIICVFMSAYMYIIDSYELYSASALTFAALVRYLAAGVMTVVGVPMYSNVGTHYTLTILACISVAVLPIPYALYAWGPKIRARSKYAVSPESLDL